MKFAKVGTIAIATIAIGLMVAALSYAAFNSSVVGRVAAQPEQEASSGRSSRAPEVEGEIARTDLVGRMKSALGSSFAGAWFDASTAQMHVGVTSTASRQSAEAVAAQASLAQDVLETPVRSTWDQLLAAQERWSARLADLFARFEVSTALRARENALEVDLSSAVTPVERAALEREAAAADVNVSIVPTPYRRLTLGLDSRCSEFKTKVAKCDPTIVAGVRILNEAGGGCTAGPAVFPQDHTKPTETYILTAGHCIENAGGEGKTWYATNKSGVKKEIGHAGKFINGEAGDVGVIQVESTDWTNKGFTPVDPAIAPWNENPNPEPYPVAGESEPAEGIETCMSGGSTGTSCGEILKLGVEVNGKKGLVEVKAAREKGDSGGPWYAKGHREIVEGTHVGYNPATGNAVFEPLATAFKELTTPKLQLLTEGNKVRHPFKIQAESAPLTLTGKQHNGSAVFGTTAGTLKCTEGTYAGSLGEAEVVQFELTPTYSGCTAFGAFAGSFDVNECKYRFTETKINEGKREGKVDVVCPSGKEITATVSLSGVPKCTIHVPPQSGLGTVTYTNIGSGATREITIDVAITGLKYTHTAGTGFGSCTGGSAENGTIETSVSVKGENGEKQVGFFTS